MEDEELAIEHFESTSASKSQALSYPPRSAGCRPYPTCLSQRVASPILLASVSRLQALSYLLCSKLLLLMSWGRRVQQGFRHCWKALTDLRSALMGAEGRGPGPMHGAIGPGAGYRLEARPCAVGCMGRTQSARRQTCRTAQQLGCSCSWLPSCPGSASSPAMHDF